MKPMSMAQILAIIGGIGASIATPLALSVEQDPPQADTQEPKDPQNRLNNLERRIQLLEQALVEKDARIGELNKKVETLSQSIEERNRQPQSPVQQQPGYQFQIPPDQLQQFQKQLDQYFRHNFDDDNFFDKPQWREDDQDGEDENFRGRRPTRPRAEDRFKQDPFFGRGPDPKPRLGVHVQPNSAELRQRYNNNVTEGAFIIDVTPKSVADRAGLLEGDCAVRFMNQPIRSPQDLIDLIQTAPEGTHKLVIMREGKEKAFDITLEQGEGKERGLNEPRMLRDGQWLRRGGQGIDAKREINTEVRSSALELTEELTRELKLSEEQRTKMGGILAEARQGLNADFEKITGGQADATYSMHKVQALADLRVAEAEFKLKEVLSGEQLKTWKEYRERHSTLDIYRQEKLQHNAPSLPKKESPAERSEF